MAKKIERRSSRNMAARQWRRMDLHLHTPASNDYHEPRISYLDILRQADVRGLNIIAFTDHNTVAGYRDMRHEIEQLEYLESLGRLEADERRRLESYHKLLDKILVLPGFEFTATFGFHILGIFPPETPVAFLEHILLSLNIQVDQLTEGSSTVGASSDVLTAYRLINANGGLVIAAHANSGNGVVMRGLDFGGQTKIAYTQDPNLHCLEVTDLEKRGRYSTRRFFDGSKPEYPRAMRCIQGSDAHRLVRESSSSKNLGVGDRATEILLPAVNFDNLKSILSSQDYSLTRPFRGPASPMDFVLVARDEGPSIVQAFHKSMNQRGGHLNRVLEDVCAMANTNGGTIYIGLSSDPKEEIIGVRDTARAIKFLTSTIARRMSPDPGVNVDNLVSSGKTIVRISVPPGKEVPYAIDDNHFYVRDEAETTLAVRDEIVRLIERQITGTRRAIIEDVSEQSRDVEKPSISESKKPDTRTQASVGPPRTGVEIVSSEERDGTLYHTVKDLRNGSLINNVSRSSARKLWHYAITQKESGKYDVSQISWRGNIAILGQRRRDNYVWYDLAMRDDSGMHVFYGVTDSGLNDRWLELVTDVVN